MENAYRELMDRQSQALASAGDRYQELWRTYFADIQRSVAEAREKAQELGEEYLKEFRTAGGGDDAFERVGAAQINYQRSYAQVDAAYVRACQEHYRTLRDGLITLEAEYARQNIDGLIRYLEAFKTGLSKAAPSAPPNRAAKD